MTTLAASAGIRARLQTGGNDLLVDKGRAHVHIEYGALRLGGHGLDGLAGDRGALGEGACTGRGQTGSVERRRLLWVTTAEAVSFDRACAFSTPYTKTSAAVTALTS